MRDFGLGVGGRDGGREGDGGWRMEDENCSGVVNGIG